MDDVAIVIDNGSSTTRAGFAGDDVPQATFPSVTGRRHPSVTSKLQLDQDYYVGGDAELHRDLLAMRHPVDRGNIVDWDGMQKLWEYTFRSIKTLPEEHAVYLTAAPLTSWFMKEKMAQIMFETFNAPAMHIGNQGMLALYSSGRTAGVVLGSGDGVTFCQPVHEGYLKESVVRYQMAGKDLTERLMSLLTEKGNSFISTVEEEHEIAKDIKEKHCFVAADFDREMITSKLALSAVEVDYALPDGQVIKLGSERFVCAEALFQPHFIGTETRGVHNVLYDSVMRCDSELREELFGNIVLAGGNTMFPGFGSRLLRELGTLNTQKRNKVITLPYAKDAVWIGATIMASLTTMESLWLTKAEYEENGTSTLSEKLLLF